MSSAIHALTDATFDEEVRSSPVPVLVEFWAEWCPPCTMIATLLDSIASDYDGRLRVFKINADEQPELARRYGVMSVPTLLTISDGAVQLKMVGARSRARLLQEIDGLIS
jgi:thioredoxin 1